MSTAGELLTADVCGPLDESFSGKRFLVVFKVSFTKFWHGFVIKEKSEVKKALKEMIVYARNHGHVIKDLLTHNRVEFENAEMKGILRSYGITQRLSAPYTSEQVGASERENRTIVKMARTFKYSNPDVNFPEEAWAELTFMF